MTNNSNNHPVNALAVRDRLRLLLGLLGVVARVELTTYNTGCGVALSPLAPADADKLADALTKIPEIRPYLTGHGSAAEERVG